MRGAPLKNQSVQFAQQWMQTVTPAHAVKVIREHFPTQGFLVRRIESASKLGTFHSSPTLADAFARLMAMKFDPFQTSEPAAPAEPTQQTELF